MLHRGGAAHLGISVTWVLVREREFIDPAPSGVGWLPPIVEVVVVVVVILIKGHVTRVAGVCERHMFRARAAGRCPA